MRSIVQKDRAYPSQTASDETVMFDPFYKLEHGREADVKARIRSAGFGGHIVPLAALVVGCVLAALPIAIAGQDDRLSLSSPDAPFLAASCAGMLAVLCVLYRASRTSSRREVHALEIMERQQAALRDILDSSGLYAMSVDSTGAIRMMNGAMLDAVGRPFNEVFESNYHARFVPEAERKTALARASNLSRSLDSTSYEEKLLAGDGRQLTVGWQSYPIRDVRGEPAGRFALGVDLTALRKAEESVARLELVMEESLNEIYLLDAQALRFIQVNEAGRSNLGYSMEELRGLAPESISPEYTADMLDQLFDPLRSGEQSTVFINASHQRKDGSRYPVEVRVRLTSHDSVPAFVAIACDTSRRKEAEESVEALKEQLHQAQKMEAVGQLAGGVAHDMNNLLTVIFAGVERARGETYGNVKAHEALQLIAHGAEEAAAAARSLLTFSRRLPVKKQAVNLRETLAESHDLIRRVLPATIELETDIAASPDMWVEADPTQLQQIVLNLVVNARDAMPKGGHLLIAVTPDRRSEGVGEHDTVRIRVSDTGLGISPELRERVFDAFFSTKGRGRGAGLGLTVVRGIVASIGGRVEMQTDEHRGTTVSIVLPRIRPPALSEPEVETKSTTAGRGHGECLLIVEDNDAILQAAGMTLREMGYWVFEAQDGSVGLDCYYQRRDRIRMLILDVDLPGRDGIDCLRRIRATGSVIPAIVITGSVNVAHDSLVDEHAVLLRKPFQMAELCGLVSAGLQAAARGTASTW
jgi:PAS domain S-box-containing protein